jgi:hypothetical protein
VRQPPSNPSTVDVERAHGSRFPRAGAFDQAEDLSGGGAPGYRETWARWGSAREVHWNASAQGMAR